MRKAGRYTRWQKVGGGELHFIAEGGVGHSYKETHAQRTPSRGFEAYADKDHQNKRSTVFFPGEMDRKKKEAENNRDFLSGTFDVCFLYLFDLLSLLFFFSRVCGY